MRDAPSGLHFYSIGIVANNKALNESTIMVTPTEKLTMLDGELVSLPVGQSVQGTTASGESYSTNVDGDLAIQAKWFNWASAGRETAPDVRRGERVVLLRFADTDEFWWFSDESQNHLRKLETIRYRWSATKDESADSTLPENSYTLEISTHTGAITLSTSKANGETCIYGIQINTRDGRIIIADDIGNEFDFNSKESVLSLTNSYGSTLVLDKNDILLKAIEHMIIEAGRTLLVKSPDIKVEATNIVVETTTLDTTAQTITTKTGTYSIQASGAYSIQSASYGLTSGSISMRTTSGSARFDGPIIFGDAVTFEQPITANGITSSAPIRGPSNTI